MENSSKVLIIAGVILLSIVIISIGMYIYNSTAQTIYTTSEQSNNMSYEMINAKLLLYEGKQRGKNVKELLAYIITCNEGSFNDIEQNIGIYSNNKILLDKIDNQYMKSCLLGNRKYGVIYPENINMIINYIDSSKEYNISFEYGKTINKITKVHVD